MLADLWIGFDRRHAPGFDGLNALFLVAGLAGPVFALFFEHRFVLGDRLLALHGLLLRLGLLLGLLLDPLLGPLLRGLLGGGLPSSAGSGCGTGDALLSGCPLRGLGRLGRLAALLAKGTELFDALLAQRFEACLSGGFGRGFQLAGGYIHRSRINHPSGPQCFAAGSFLAVQCLSFGLVFVHPDEKPRTAGKDTDQDREHHWAEKEVEDILNHAWVLYRVNRACVRISLLNRTNHRPDPRYLSTDHRDRKDLGQH